MGSWASSGAEPRKAWELRGSKAALMQKQRHERLEEPGVKRHTPSEASAVTDKQRQKTPGSVTVSLHPQLDEEVGPRKQEVEDFEASNHDLSEEPEHVSRNNENPLAVAARQFSQGVDGFARGAGSFVAAVGTAASSGLVWQQKGEAQVFQQNGAMEELLIESRLSSVMVALIICVIYLAVVFAIGFAYVKIKTADSVLNDGMKSLPADDFSDGICACSSSLPIALTACLIPCVRWSDTMQQSGFLQFFQALGIFTCLLLVNTFISGLGTLLIVILGVFYRVKIREASNLPTSPKTHALDFLVWFCCTPCAIAQEARHVERTQSMKQGKS